MSSSEYKWDEAMAKGQAEGNKMVNDTETEWAIVVQRVKKSNATAGLVEDVAQRDGKMLKTAKAKAKGRLSDPGSAFKDPKAEYGACR